MNVGFFSDDPKPAKIRKPAAVKVPKSLNCQSCGLSNSCNSPKMGIQGEGKKGILIVIEQPSRDDDRTGKYLSGNTGQIIKGLFNDNEGFNLDSDCWVMASVQCYSDKEPKGPMIQACAQKVQKAIAELKPKVIITFGKMAISSVVDQKLVGRLSNTTMVDWAGCAIPDQEFQCFICPSWEPSKLYGKNDIDPVILRQMASHIKEGIYLSTVLFYESNYQSDAMVILEKEEATDLLRTMLEKQSNVAIDYETTGLKPHRKGHEIVSASISDGLFGYAFPFFDDPVFRRTWKKLMLSKGVGKICHNSKFENTWTKEILGYPIENIVADTMLDAHIIHNKKKTNLKFLSYTHFGIIYENDMSVGRYMEADKDEVDEKGGNAFNNIKEAPLPEMLKYNALDSLFTYKLWELQNNQLTTHTRQGSAFFLDASTELAKAEGAGILLDEKQARAEYDNLTKKMDRFEQRVVQSEEMEKWDREKPFRISASGDLSHLLFECLGYKAKKEDLTPTGKPKADIEAMEKYDTPVVTNVLKWRKYKKVRDTYLAGFIKESSDSIIHASLNLGRVSTYRSSCDAPNLQNIPARDAEVMQLLRKLILARPGHKLAEYDYKAMEAVLLCVYNKDPNWIAYVSNIESDMHRDMAAKILMKEKKDVQKDERQTAKNGFVFPTVYTSYWFNTAKGMWDQFSQVTKDHLKGRGVKNLDEFREHVKQVERWFWEDQFPVGYEWMNKTLRDYEKKGFIDLYTGFRCYGPMTRAEVINYRVQGTASHCKLWTLNKISKLIEKKKMNSRILLEIHDSIIPDVDPAEEDYLDYQMWLYGTQKIREEWPWINVPLFIEKKISVLNGNWAEMDNKGLLKG